MHIATTPNQPHQTHQTQECDILSHPICGLSWPRSVVGQSFVAFRASGKARNESFVAFRDPGKAGNEPFVAFRDPGKAGNHPLVAFPDRRKATNYGKGGSFSAARVDFWPWDASSGAAKVPF